jgi:hypothetical protein
MSRIFQIKHLHFLKLAQVLLVLCSLPAMAGADHKCLVRFNKLPIPGATVIVTQGATKHVAVTNLQGAYLFPNRAEGSWTIQIEMTGFEPMSRVIVTGADQNETEWELTMLPFSEMETVVADPVSSRTADDTHAGKTKRISGASVIPQKIEADGIPTLQIDRAQGKPPSIFASRRIKR